MLKNTHQCFTTLSPQFTTRAALHHPLHTDSHMSARSAFPSSPSLALRTKPEIFPDRGRLSHTEASFEYCAALLSSRIQRSTSQISADIFRRAFFLCVFELGSRRNSWHSFHGNVLHGARVAHSVSLCFFATGLPCVRRKTNLAWAFTGSRW